MASGRAREFLERGWQLFDEKSAGELGPPRASTGPVAGVALGDALRKHAAAVQPSWPRPRDRDGDHAHHLRLIDILSRVERQRR